MTAAFAALAAAGQGARVLRGYRFELIKLLSQWRLRLLILASRLVPTALVSELSRQNSLPADTVFGRWMHTTGWAGSLVVLGFVGTYALPLLTSVVAGDVFAAEDRLGTWRHLLVAIRSPRLIFAAKALASLTVIAVMVAGLACSSAAAVLVVGNRPLIGLDAHVLASADTAGKVVLAWLSVFAPTLALAAIGLLGSMTLGRSRWGCCCRRWPGWQWMVPRSCRYPWPSASPCPATASLRGAACSPARWSWGRCWSPRR